MIIHPNLHALFFLACTMNIPTKIISEKHFICVRELCLEMLLNIQLERKAKNEKYVPNKMQVTINLLAIKNT